MGGSESRYALEGESGEFLMVPNKRYGILARTGPRDFGNRLQKFRLQFTESGAYIRFDNHPQPAIRIAPDGESVELFNAASDELGQWVIGMAERDKLPETHGSWIYVSVFNIATKRVLVDKGRGTIRVKQEGEFTPESAKWKLHYVCSQLSSGEVGIALGVPLVHAVAITVFAADYAISAWAARVAKKATEAAIETVNQWILRMLDFIFEKAQRLIEAVVRPMLPLKQFLLQSILRMLVFIFGKAQLLIEAAVRLMLPLKHF